MSDLRMTNLYVWRRVIDLMYFPLESFLTTQELADECVIAVDPTFQNDVELAHRIAEKYPKTKVVEFVWPDNVPGDGSRIGIASNFALAQATGTHVLNVQADEVWHPNLLNAVRDNWKKSATDGFECFRFKVLHTEFNASQFQGGGVWDGRKDTEEWRWQKGAGYNSSVKIAKRCPAIRFDRDAWSFSGCGTMAHVVMSEAYPIMHLHDFHRDSYIALRRNAADAIWTDKEKFGHYGASADGVESSKESWYNSPVWMQKVSPFDELLPDIVKPLIGETSYRVRFELL